MPGTLYAGTSGFAYRSWAPAFYAPEERGSLLAAYSARLPAVELNNTFYRRPSPRAVAAWLAVTPTHFRFCPKAQRGAAWRAWSAPDPREPIGWLTDGLRAFGERLGCVLLSVPASVQRDDEALERVLRAWPPGMPLALELPHPSWARDEVHAQLDRHGVALVATDRDGADEPDLRRFGGRLYVRLRRSAYTRIDADRWAQRLEPFLADGVDAFVFFRHDETGEFARLAEALLAPHARGGSSRRAAYDRKSPNRT